MTTLASTTHSPGGLLRPELRGAFLLAAGVTVVVSAGCREGSGDFVVGDGDGLYPAETLTDWVSWAVQVSRVEILREEEVPPPQAVLDRGEGYIARKVFVRVLETVWSSRHAKELAPTEFAFLGSGWVLRNDGRKVRFALRNSARIEVGGRYVMPITTAPIFSQPQTNDSGRRAERSTETYTIGWSPLSTSAVFNVKGDAVASADVEVRGSNTLARKLLQKQGSEIAATLDAAPVDPTYRLFWV